MATRSAHGPANVAGNQRDQLTRTLSASGMTQDNEDSVEMRIGAGWASGRGFGEQGAFGESWSGFDNAHRNSAAAPALPLVRAGTLPGRPNLPHHRSSSEGGGQPTRRNTAGVSSVMHDAARCMQWDRVKLLCEESPITASFIGPGGYTALHHVCSRRCPEPEVFEAVIKACPDALMIEETTKGWTPLHLACRFKCESKCVGELLNLYSGKGRHTVSVPDRQRRTPLYYAVRYAAPTGVVPQVLEADPSVVLADDNRNLQSPLELVWDEIVEKLAIKQALTPFIGEQSGETSPQVKRERLEEMDLFTNWKQANLFLKAAFGFPLDEDKVLMDAAERKWRILHATAAVKCHPSLFQMACALFPEQARETDENDLHGQVDGAEGSGKQTALHLAASSNASGAAGKAVITELLMLHPEAAKTPDGIDGSYPLHRIAENKHKQHWTFDGINPLYMIYPAAAHETDQNGKLPLHRAAVAIAHKRSEGPEAEDLVTRSIICNLLQVHPQGAAARDNDGCHPLHLIAKHGGDWTEEVQAVHEGHTRAVTVRTGRGLDSSLPIHLAAANPNATGAFIRKLVELNPRGVSQEDGQGKLPLHLACELGKDWEEDGLDAIYNAFVQAASATERNDRQWTALHMASAYKGLCGGLIEKLVELHPASCDVPDSSGRLPFHLACEAGKRWEEGLRALFDGNPYAISAQDNKGRLPLFIVAHKHATEAAVEALAREAEDTMDLADLNEDDEEEKHELLDVLYNLIQSDPNTLPES